MGIRGFFKSILLWGLCFVIVCQPVFAAESCFDDVKESDWFYEGVSDLSERGLILASSDNTFRPYETVSVAEFIKLMVTSQGIEVLEDGGQGYDKYIIAGEKHSLLVDGLFSSEDYNRPISRGEASRLFLRLMNHQGELNPVNYSEQFVSHIKDIDSIGELYRNGVLICYAKGIMDRYADGSFCVERTLNRAEISLMFYRVLNISVRVLPKLEGQVEVPKNSVVEPVVEADSLEIIEEKVVYPDVISNTKLDIIHNEVDVWLWNDIDSEYLNNNKFTRSQLRKERDIFKSELQRLERLRLEVNGYIYYPALLTLKLTSVERALKAREGRLKGIDTYPTKYDTIVGSYVSEYEFNWDKNEFLNRRVIPSDEKLYDTLKYVPYEIGKGIKVIVIPYSNKVTGLFNYADIRIVAGSKIGGEIFYHELGHLWSSTYLLKTSGIDYREYLKIRGEDPNRELRKNYYDSTSENFAEDFRVTMGYRTGAFMNNMTTFGFPSEEIQENLKQYILDTMDKNSNVDTSYKKTFIYSE